MYITHVVLLYINHVVLEHLPHVSCVMTMFLLQSWGSVVDSTALVRSCVQSAVGMLRDQMEGGFRNTRRVEILLTLLTDDEEKRGSRAEQQLVRCFFLVMLSVHINPTVFYFTFKEQLDF